MTTHSLPGTRLLPARPASQPAPATPEPPASLPSEGPSDSNRSDRLDDLLAAQPREWSAGKLAASTGQALKSLFIPRNVEQAMTPDYLPTRAWWLGREVMNNLSYGFAASQATALALEMVVKAQPGAAIATVGLGLGMYWFPKLVDQLRNLTSVATSTVAQVADRRPKAWFLAGDIVDNTANAIMSCAALVPGAYAPLALGVGAAFTVAGVFKRRAQSNMFYRQAIHPKQTLPEINTKESNQSIVLNLVSMAAGAGLQYAVGGTALAAALPVIGCTTAALGVAATVRFLAHLDMENINEAVIRRAVDALERGAEPPPPDRQVRHLLGQLLEKDRVELGQSLDRLKQASASRYQQLQAIYKEEAYLLEAFKGRPHIVVKEGATSEDLVAATVQAIHVERLASSPEHAAVLAQQGSDAADCWLVEQSLARTRQQAPGLLARLGAAGWATDLVNFRDTEVRVSAEDLARPLAPNQVALP